MFKNLQLWLTEIHGILGPKNVVRFIWVSFVSVLGAVFEMLGIGLVVPLFIEIYGLSEVDTIGHGSSYLFDVLELVSADVLLFLVIALLLMGLVFRWLATHLQIAFVHHIERLLTSQFVRLVDAQSESEVHSSEFSQAILAEVSQFIGNTLMPVLQAISSAFVACALLAVMISTNLFITLSTLSLFGALYCSVFLLFRRKILKFGNRRLALNAIRFRTVSDLFFAFRELYIYKQLKLLHSRFDTAALEYEQVQRSLKILGLFPRFLIEGMLLLFLGIALHWLSQNSQANLGLMLGTVGTFVYCFMRLAPTLQLSYACATQIWGNRAGLSRLSQLNASQHYADQFQTSEADSVSSMTCGPLVAKDVCFEYEATKILDSVNLSVNKGDRILIEGASGAGKSTLINIMMGLMKPTRGTVDCSSANVHDELGTWFDQISLVPQDPFIFDESALFNVCLGEQNVDRSWLNEIWRACAICDFISWDDFIGEKNRLGERGEFISGGQRQRIVLARALLKRRPFLFLDEGTNQLDISTEALVLNQISELVPDVTIIAVRHGSNIPLIYTRRVKLESGKVIQY